MPFAEKCYQEACDIYGDACKYECMYVELLCEDLMCQSISYNTLNHYNAGRNNSEHLSMLYKAQFINNN